MVRDHLEAKHVFDLEERAQQEENEAFRQENLHLRNSIRSLTHDMNSTIDEARKNYEQNSEEFSDKFREQTVM